MTELRPYQVEVIERAEGEIAAGRKALLVAPTGSGKTVVAAELIRRKVERGGSVLFLAHRLELIQQAAEKLHDAGIDAGIIKAGIPPRPGERVQIAAVQTLHARAIRSKRIEMPLAALVIVDEAHHVRARTYRQILDAFPRAAIAGLTATPCRGDGRGLGNVFDKIIECPQVAELTVQGFLVPPRVFAPATPDLTDIRVRHGDYVENQLAQRMNRPQLVADVVSTWLKNNAETRRQTVVFATGVAHSIALRNEFRAAGVMAEHLDGNTPDDERKAILARLATGQVEIVCNAMVLVEGWDSPSVSCAVLARPTKSMGLFRQMTGRVLRPHPGKTDALILDHSGAVFAHGLPDEPVRWTLHADRRAVNPSQLARLRGERPKLTECPECKAIRMQGSPCPACGWRPQPKAKPVHVAEGELGEVHRNRTPGIVVYSDQDKRFWHGALLYIANERAQARPFNVRGWVYHKYLEKFGQKPPFNPPPSIAPSAEIRAWVRSRDIAYAKAMQRSMAS